MEIKTPDIGVDHATVAEILVKVGDQVAENDSLVVVESDKASVEVPSTSAGVVAKILVKEGDEIAQGTPLIELESGENQEKPKAEAVEEKPAPAPEPSKTTTVLQEKAKPASSSTSKVVEVKVPDIGVEKASVGEILVKVGDSIEKDDSIVVVESDKATVEVPSTEAGTVESIAVKEGDTIQEGVLLITVKTVGGEAPEAPPVQVNKIPAPQASHSNQQADADTQPAQNKQPAGEIEIIVPDLGVDKAAVSEILVKVGDSIEKDDSILVVESDKATVEVPSSASGVIKAIHIEVGQDVRQGIKIATVEAEGQKQNEAPQKETEQAPAAQSEKSPATPKPAEKSTPASESTHTEKLSKAQQAENAKVYAGPAVRKLARELGVLLAEVKSSGPHERIMKDDVFAYVKGRLTEAPKVVEKAAPAVKSGLPKLPDFTAHGGVEEKPLTRLQQVSIPQLCLNNFIPQVTQFDQADITELEAWRGELKGGFKQQGVSLTILAFIAKALAHLLKEEPYFAAHLADDEKSVLLRKEIHMGIAVATPDGLTVPVLRNPDQKSIKDIAIELGELSKKAREKKLSPKDLQGANFTITSLGSIGGTAFTPLVNWPQVAILGISPATMQPVWNGKDFEPRLMLPLSLSYDHRVINGADAARFTNKLTKLLSDIRSLLL
ncbi:2-oxo acid dehydrogenase subunit E2 [Acinetobacter boissieri]|uniref:Dihydrolipoamide acetyltransferase component of pyruvate dehydrogenase complex n=1 Tax=Acinetobacter boissieri TaxID=1219383 RepID=A0A1G6GIX1_9GAMM|nr:2-oxo acid dehydrogenase subunit E2 [Acinetobacter boissieri]SDB81961.1 pyruvate dehydrogenase E2 component (dihydrolipoamide acetyltransferase) [Acinetobacter boissieri]